MSRPVKIYHNGPVFDGQTLLHGKFAAFENQRLTQLGDGSELPSNAEFVDLAGDILSIGYVDLQVNGGGGVMFNNDPSVGTLRKIAAAHQSLGVAKLLPTLITDTRKKTRTAIEATISAIASSVPGIAGLHLEGPHLSIARKGAHDAALIRPMDDEDLAMLLEAAKKLPCLKITVAPENVTLKQVKALSDASILVSLGHSDACFDTCQKYFDAGAKCVTHLFNAMSQIGSRAPGLVGAALANGAVSTGLIADAVHVHPSVMSMAWRAKCHPGQVFLVSDAMAVAGTTLREFQLEGRRIKREAGQLRLLGGTLAGADLDLTTAISVMVNMVGVTLEEALFAASSAPAKLSGMPMHCIKEGVLLDDLIRISSDLTSVSSLRSGLQNCGNET